MTILLGWCCAAGRCVLVKCGQDQFDKQWLAFDANNTRTQNNPALCNNPCMHFQVLAVSTSSLCIARSHNRRAPLRTGGEVPGGNDSGKRAQQQQRHQHDGSSSQTVKPLCAEIQLRVYARLKQATRNAVGRRDVRAVSEVPRARVRSRSRKAETT